MAVTKIYIVYYSLHGHVETMAREVLRGANEVPDVEATLWQIPETLPEKILEKVQAAPRPDDVPEIQGEQLGEADGFMFGFPSRLTAVTKLAHHGMIFVPLGYTFGKGMYEMGEVKGGSPYGSGTYAADGSREPTELEIEQANYHGKYFAGIAKKLKKRSPV
uniref:Flavodoxin-like domain-containing protein n=1 Tax=Brassica oleracea var. oleracea TaxID=109376 RepID=A0A0D3AL62_BRAOL